MWAERLEAATESCEPRQVVQQRPHIESKEDQRLRKTSL
jgi:hypothetical protein